MDSGIGEKTKYNAVYVHDFYGLAGTAWPIGTPGMPVGVTLFSGLMTDAFAIAAARRLTDFRINSKSSGNAAIPSDLPATYNFYGWDKAGDSINLNGKIVLNSQFKNLMIFGTAIESPAYLNADNCEVILDAGATLGGTFNGCQFAALAYLSVAAIFSDCEFWDTSLSIVDGGGAQLYRCAGLLTIKDMVAPGYPIIITGIGLKLTIDASCVGGTIEIYGDVDVIDNSDGTTVIDHSTKSFVQETPYCITVASATLRNSNDAEKTTNSLVYAKIKETIIKHDMAGVRIKFDLKTSNVLGTAYGQIRKNGVIVGAEQTDVTGGYVTFSEDLTGFVAGDKIQIWAKISNALYLVKVQNFRFYYDMTEILSVVNNDP